MRARLSCLVCMSLLIPFMSCATPENLPERHAFREIPEVQEPVRSGEPSSTTIQAVESKLKHTKGSQVLISKRLLNKLLEEEKSSELARNKLSGEIEALKKVDREEPLKFVQ
jgi:hypothetical protein